MNRFSYIDRTKFVKGEAEKLDTNEIALVKGETFDAPLVDREIKGRDALKSFLEAEGVGGDELTRAVDETAADEVSMPFVLSTNAVDRQNDSIKQAGWKLENYRKNPVVLWAHDHSVLPVARASSVYVAGDKLKAVDRFSSDHELARTVAAMYRKGFLNAVSVGFRPLKWAWNEERGGYGADFEECELLEHSAVPVPAHQDALIEARSAGLDVACVMSWAEQVLASGGGLVLPKSLIEDAILRAKGSRFVLDLGDRKAIKADPLPEPAPVLAPNLADELAAIKTALLVLTAKAAEPAPAPAVEPEPEVKAAPVAVDLDKVRAAFREMAADALAPLRKFNTDQTGRLD